MQVLRKKATGAKHDYILIQELGKGSFGAVYKSLKCGEMKAVAIKKMTMANEATIEYQNLKVLLKQCAEYAVCLIDFFKMARDNYIVMDYIPGGYTLMHYIYRLPLETTPDFVGRIDRTDVAIHLIKGLDQLHSIGIAHQDIKEGNIMWDFVTNKPKYVDFGGVLIDNGTKFQRCWSGTYYTSSPEIRDGTVIGSFNTARGHDIWSIGVVLYDWFTITEENIKSGKVSSYDDYFYKKSQAQINKMIKNISNKGVIPEFPKKIVRMLLEINLEKRLQNWIELLKMIDCMGDKAIIGKDFGGDHYKKVYQKWLDTLLKDDTIKAAKKKC